MTYSHPRSRSFVIRSITRSGVLVARCRGCRSSPSSRRRPRRRRCRPAGPGSAGRVGEVGVRAADDRADVGRPNDGVVVRPTSRQCSARISSDLRVNSSGSAEKLVYCAYFAAILSVTFSPPPAIHSGIPAGCNGFKRRWRRSPDTACPRRSPDRRAGVAHDLHTLVEAGQPHTGRREAAAVGATHARTSRHRCPSGPCRRRSRPWWRRFRQVHRVAVAIAVHICPKLDPVVVAASAAISVHASWVASSVGIGTVWKWS